MISRGDHWDAVYSGTEDSQLGWYEKDPSQTLRLLNFVPRWRDSTVFLPGAGTTALVEELLSNGAGLILNDISTEALTRLKSRLGDAQDKTTWLCQDIAQPFDSATNEIDIWIDRAVLHFLTDKDDIRGYFANVRSILKVDGHAIFAEFSSVGATKCAGLPVHRYSVEQLSEHLGSSFKLITHFEYTHVNPHGDSRPYIYALYKREQ